MDLTTATVAAFLTEYGVPLDDLKITEMASGPVPPKENSVFLAIIPRDAFTVDEAVLERNEDLLDEVEMALKNWEGTIFFVGRARAIYLSDRDPLTSLTPTE